MYEARTQEEILAEMIGESKLPSSKIEGTFEYDVLASNAIEFAKTEEEMAEMHLSAFGITAWEVNAGASGNVAAGTINLIPISISGIRSVTNAEATNDGYDREDDETYRERYLKHVRLPAVSGNPYQYEEWALEFEGVGAARFIRTWNVAMLTVISAIPKLINIEAKIIGNLNEEDFYQGVKDYFKKITNKVLTSGRNSQKKYYVSYAQISSIIVVEGEADDHLNLKINGGTENIILEDEELPTLGTVTFL